MTEKPGGDPSFEARLQAARGKQGLDTSPRKPGQDPGDLGANPWGIGLRVGVELVAAMVVAVAIGYGLDRLFGTLPILTAVFVPLGGAAGILNLWRLFAPKPTEPAAGTATGQLTPGRQASGQARQGDKQGGG
jgi:ATP synthase protein I